MKKYKNFWLLMFNWSGRTSCADFWAYLLLTLIFLIVFSFSVPFSSGIEALVLSIVSLSGWCIGLLAVLSAAIRRMNDINMPRFYVLIPFYNIILLLKESDDNFSDLNNNKMAGKNPKFKAKYLGVILLSSLLLFIFFCVFTYLSQETDYIPYVHLHFEKALFLVFLDIVLIPVHFLLSVLFSLCAGTIVKNLKTKIIIYACALSFLITVIIYHIAIFLQQG